MDKSLPRHPNGMRFEAFDSNTILIEKWEVYSIGGGEIVDDSGELKEDHIYPHTTMADILDHLEKEGGTLWEYVLRVEGDSILDHVTEVWDTMKSAIRRGLENDGTLPGELKLKRKAPGYFVKANMQKLK